MGVASHGFVSAQRKPECREFSPGQVVLLCPADEDYPKGRVLLVCWIEFDSQKNPTTVNAIDLYNLTSSQYGDFCLDNDGEFLEPVENIETQKALLHLPISQAGESWHDQTYIISDPAVCQIEPDHLIGPLGIYNGFKSFVSFCQKKDVPFRAFYGLNSFNYADIKQKLLTDEMAVVPSRHELVFGSETVREDLLHYFYGYPSINGTERHIFDARLAVN